MMAIKAERFFQSAFFISILLVVIYCAGQVRAQENPEAVAKKYGVTFPIQELGQCRNLNECRVYCDDPLHAEACIKFAQSKGFYQEATTDNREDDLLTKAKSELGCDSPSSCQAFCSQESNFEKCSAFAKKNSLSGGHLENPTEQRFLERAKEILGCDSPSSCQNFCENEANREKCSQFAQEMGLRGGERFVGPGGCTSQETCQAFCSNPSNYQICSSYGASSGGSFSGPGGCNSEQSCRSYCEANPKECGYGGQLEMTQYNPQEMCSKTPNCSWSSVNNTCECQGSYTTENGNYEKFCQENPDRCQQGGVGGLSTEEYCKQYPDRCQGYTNYPGTPQDYEKYCRENPEKCGGSSTLPTGTNGGGYGGDPATECGKYPGCSWTGTTCQCQGQPGNPTTDATANPPPTGGTSPPDPATACAQSPGCTWTGTTCQCGSQVQGVQTSKKPDDLLKVILDFFFGN